MIIGTEVIPSTSSLCHCRRRRLEGSGERHNWPMEW